MEDLKKHALLLIILTFLLLAKFLYMPIIEWQNALIIEINTIEKKLRKIEGVLGNEEKILHANKQYEQQFAITKHLFFAQNSQATFKLQQQQMLEKVFEKSNIKITRFGWENTIPLVDLQVEHYPLKVYLSGKISDFVKLTTQLERYSPFIEVSGLVLVVKKQTSSNLGETKGNISLNLYAEYLPIKQSIEESPLYVK